MSEIEKKELNVGEVAAFLRRYPDFLMGFPELAMILKLPKEHGASTSLASYQLEVLRDKNRNLHRKLQELIAIASENEQLMARVHSFTCGLMRATSANETLARVAAMLTEDFHTELVRIVLFDQNVTTAAPSAEWLLHLLRQDQRLAPFAEMLNGSEALCGRLRDEKLALVFADKADAVKSAAMIPIHKRGLLAVGSSDANRFFPGMGTLFLRLMSESVDAALARFDTTPDSARQSD